MSTGVLRWGPFPNHRGIYNFTGDKRRTLRLVRQARRQGVRARAIRVHGSHYDAWALWREREGVQQ